VHRTLSALRLSQAPVVIVMHEFAYPWRYRDWRGNMWALTQRMALLAVMRAAAAVIATADLRVTWLQSRWWLPRRRALIAPVFSNLPPPSAAARHHAEPVIGLFGYAYVTPTTIEIVLDSLGELWRRGVRPRLTLLGSPGRSSSAGATWLAAARSRDLAEGLSFSGVLPGQELSDALASCDVLLFADTAGPTSRKGSLAASLASGRPVLAIDGPQSWRELVHAHAVRIVEPTSAALADGIASLLLDEGARASLGARGRSFAEDQMGVGRTVQAVRTLLDDVLAAPGS
jgi:glycosyltransferase involved in cell wall biosynthesis